jgi:hypothetical protein
MARSFYAGYFATRNTPLRAGLCYAYGRQPPAIPYAGDFFACYHSNLIKNTRYIIIITILSHHPLIIFWKFWAFKGCIFFMMQWIYSYQKAVDRSSILSTQLRQGLSSRSSA